MLGAAGAYFAFQGLVLLAVPVLVSNRFTEAPASMTVACLAILSVSAALADLPASRLARLWGVGRIVRWSSVTGCTGVLILLVGSGTAPLIAGLLLIGGAMAGMMAPILSAVARLGRGAMVRVQGLNAAVQRAGSLTVGAVAYVAVVEKDVSPALLLGLLACAGLGLLSFRMPNSDPASASENLAAPPRRAQPPQAERLQGLLLYAVVPLLALYGASFLPLAAVTQPNLPGATVATVLVVRETLAIVTSGVLYRWPELVTPQRLVSTTLCLGIIGMLVGAIASNVLVLVAGLSLHGCAITGATVAANIHLHNSAAPLGHERAFAQGGVVSRLAYVLWPLPLGLAVQNVPILNVLCGLSLSAILVVYLYLNGPQLSRHRRNS